LCDNCRRALEVQPKHANSLYNYAVMLDTHLKRKEEAEALYRRALAVEPRHAYALYNLAVLLEERYSTELIAHAQATAEVAATMGPNIAAAMEDPDFKAKDLKTREDILALYQKAVEADPRDTTTLADYGRYVDRVAAR
jgi:tetratricopeptide (TPR) repeat protein